MNKLTKSELIEKLKPLRNPSNARQYNVAVMDIINIIQDTEIIPDPVPEVDERERIVKKYPVDSWVKQVNNGAIYQVDYYAKELVNLKDEDSLSTILISELELNFEPYELDTELEEAKKRFSVGSWYHSLSFHVAYKVTEVKRRSDYKAKPIFVCSADGYEYDVKFCTPATLPTDAPIDLELAKAKKLVGRWVRCEGMASTLYKIEKVYRADHDRVIAVSDGGHDFEARWCTIAPVWVSEPRCCVDDPPKNGGKSLVLRLDGVSSLEWFDRMSRMWCYKNNSDPIQKGDVWYALPQGGK